MDGLVKYVLARSFVTKTIATLDINPKYVRESFEVINEWVKTTTRGQVSAKLISNKLSFSNIVDNSKYGAFQIEDRIFIQEQGYQYFIERLW